MKRFKFVIVDLEGKLSQLILERGIAVYLLFDSETGQLILVPGEGLHRRKGFCREEED